MHDPYQSAHVRRGLRQFLSGRIIQAIASVAVMLIMVRSMTIIDYAHYITATALATFLGTLSIMGLDRVLTRYVPEARLKATPARLIAFIRKMNLLRLVAIGTLIVSALIGWPYLSPLLQLPAEGLILPVLLFAVAHAFLQFQTIVMQSLMLQDGLRNATTATWLVRIAMLLIAITSSASLPVDLALWITISSEAIGWIWMVICTTAHCNSYRASFDHSNIRSDSWPPSFREMLLFGWHNYLMGQASFPAQARVQQLIASMLLPVSVVAAFGFFRTLSEQIRNYLPLQMMKNLAEPVMFGRYIQTKDFELLNSMASALLKINLLVIVPMSAWLIIASDPIVGFFTNGKFKELTWALGILVFSQAISSQVTILNIVSNACGTSHRLPVATITASICTVFLLWTQISSIGVLALVLSDAFFCSLVIFMIIRGLKAAQFFYKFDVRSLSVMMMLCVPPSLIGLTVMTYSPTQFQLFASAASGILITGCYWLLNVIWKPLNQTERDLLNKIAGRFRIPF